MIIVHVVYKMEKENRKGFLNDLIAKEIQERTEKEPGNLKYRFAIPLDCEDEVVLTEEWVDQAAVDQHYKGEAIADLQNLKKVHGVESFVNFFSAEKKEK